MECGVSIIHEIFLECLWKMTCHFLALIFIGKYSLFVPGTNNSDLHLSLDWFFYAYMSYTLRTQEVSCWNSRSMLYFRRVLGALNTIAFTYQKRSMLAIFSLHLVRFWILIDNSFIGLPFLVQSMVARADAKVNELRKSIDLLKAESEKLEVTHLLCVSWIGDEQSLTSVLNSMLLYRIMCWFFFYFFCVLDNCSFSLLSVERESL